MFEGMELISIFNNDQKIILPKRTGLDSFFGLNLLFFLCMSCASLAQVLQQPQIEHPESPAPHPHSL